MIKFKSKVVRVNEMGGKWVVEFKEKVYEAGTEGAIIDDAQVNMYDTAEACNEAVTAYFS
jgi:hypothetical protein